MKENSMKKARILVVEDESIVALDVKQRLEGMGYTVLDIVAYGDQAIQKAETLRPDLILMDIKLKGKMDGIQAAEIIHSCFNLPIIFLTAFADEPTLQRARVTESFGYILKPFEERELSINIEMALYKHEMENKLRENEIRLRTIFTSALDGLFLIDPQGLFQDANPAACAIFGYSREEILQSGIWLLTYPEDLEQVLHFGKGVDVFQKSASEYKMRHKNGSEIWVEMTLAPIQVDGKPQAVGVLRDITTRKRTDAALRESEERYTLAVQGANDGLWDWNLKTGSVYYSPRWKEMLGLAESEIGNRIEDWHSLIHPDDQKQFKIGLANHLAGLTPHFQNESRIRTHDDKVRWMLTRGVAVCDSDGVPYRMSGSQSDVTERKLAEQQLLHDALHDALTGLPNRVLFLDRLERTMERARRSGNYSFSVIFLDLDRFKIINDCLGHNLGDSLLNDFGKRLVKILRSSDTLARLGGDEFVILLEGTGNIKDSEAVAEKIQEDLKQPFYLNDQPVFISASIGIVTDTKNYNMPEDILRDADIAMYVAKADGKARYAFFDPKLRERAVNRLELEGDLRLALNNHEFTVFYQPILSLGTGEITGFEALLRWFHPIRGSIPPVDFISVAEETGLILSIGRWVLEEACHQLRTWQIQFPTEPPLMMSVNISGRQFVQPMICDQIQQILGETGLDPHSLKLEITESLLMENSKAVIVTLNKLRDMGIQLLIDDFGTGYSSLGYVQNFPIDTIKIDRLFVDQLSAIENHSEIAGTIVKLARELGLDTIAEGIETEEQLSLLKNLDCKYGQGWLFSKALSFEKIEVLLEKEFAAKNP
jgi:diguanylate cyclase (GGDEF)-like protein/PAS domain S-box-containing protein